MTTGASTSDRPSSPLILAPAWMAVGAPWPSGVTQTLRKAMALFA